MTEELLAALERARLDAGLDYAGVASEVNRWLKLNKYKADPVDAEAVTRVFTRKVRGCTFLYPLKESMGVRDGKFRATFDEDIMEAVDALESIKHLDRDSLRKIVASLRENAGAVQTVAAAKAALDAKLAASTGPSVTDEEKKQPRERIRK